MTIQDPTLPPRGDDLAYIEPGPALSWGAVIAGAFAAAAVSFVLLAVGTAFGLSMLSPWDAGDGGDTAAAVGFGAAVFLIVVHVLASGFGGYLAGRLREKLTNLRHDETYFRDTAHGVLVWALGAVAGAVLIACLSAQVIGGGLTLGAAGVSAAGGAMAGEHGMAGLMGRERGEREMTGYYIDSLFRPAVAPAQGNAGSTTTTGTAAAPMVDLSAPSAGAGRNVEATHAEVRRILRMGLTTDQIAPEDKTYVAQLIARDTGMSQADAERRVDEALGKLKATRDEAAAKAREAAEKARQATRFAAIWSAIALLAGGVAAGFAATWGGKARDL